MTSRKQDDSADPKSALTDYLDELLYAGTREAMDADLSAGPAPQRRQPEAKGPPRPQWDEPRRKVMLSPLTAAPAEKASPRPVVTPTESQPALSVEAPVQSASETVVEAPAAKPASRTGPVMPKSAKTAKNETRQQPERREVAPDQGRPDWAGDRFECLIFKVAGLQLAVPLVLLGAIHRLEGDLTAIPGRPDWYLGMLPIGERNLRVVDTAAWVMAGRYPQGAADNYRLVIRLDDSDWGLACDEVAQSFTLNPGDVKWRQVGGKRPWLAGTVVKHMCALIDVGAMAKLLARAETEHRLELD